MQVVTGSSSLGSSTCTGTYAATLPGVTSTSTGPEKMLSRELSHKVRRYSAALSPSHRIELWASVLVTAGFVIGYWLRLRGRAR